MLLRSLLLRSVENTSTQSAADVFAAVFVRARGHETLHTKYGNWLHSSKQCQTNIHEEPQGDYQAWTQKAKAMVEKGWKPPAAERRPFDTVVLSEAEAVGVAELYGQAVTRFFA